MNIYSNVVPKTNGLFFYRTGSEEPTVAKIIVADESVFVEFIGQTDYLEYWELPDVYEFYGPIEIPSVFPHPSKGKRLNKHLEQIGELFLTDPETGEDLHVSSSITLLENGFSSFDVAGKNGGWRHIFKTEEL